MKCLEIGKMQAMLRLLLFVVLVLTAPWLAHEKRSLQSPHDSAIAPTHHPHQQDERGAVVPDRSPESVTHSEAEHDASQLALVASVTSVQATRASSVPLEQRDLVPIDPVLPQNLKPPRAG